MRPIGGFFELENIRKRRKTFLHDDALALSSGRASLNLILQRVSPSRVYLPFYTCDALLEPLILNKIPYVFYSLTTALEPAQEISLKRNESFIYINYFGLKTDCIKKLITIHGERLIVDNTQAFFEGKYQNIFSFNSARKVFGVPDGSFLYSPQPINRTFTENTAISTNHLINRTLGLLDTAYREFTEYEKSITCEIRQISNTSRNILETIDYDRISQIRRNNFTFFAEHFDAVNTFSYHLTETAVPFCYPLIPECTIDKTLFHNRNIFVPTLWKDVLQRGNEDFSLEKSISSRLLPLPIDHRYSVSDLQPVVETVTKCIQSAKSD
ncbi:MAG: hypothetical protein JXB48_17625 [Candidatus Latescibacteria bacterium]|nr:hypothetical protein [Candidatus Latescibacterota bacterium]